jgi:starch synthase
MRGKVEALRKETPGSKPVGDDKALHSQVTKEGGQAFATGDPTGRGHNVVWIEQMVTKQEAIQLYSHCAVFCCPSVYEPFGIINLEAMACGAPVVASATGGILEVVVDGKTGHLVPFEPDSVTGFPTDGDRFARDLAKRLTELMANPELCREFGKAGRKRVEEIFSWDAIAKQTVELYRGLVKK